MSASNSHPKGADPDGRLSLAGPVLMDSTSSVMSPPHLCPHLRSIKCLRATETLALGLCTQPCDSFLLFTGSQSLLGNRFLSHGCVGSESFHRGGTGQCEKQTCPVQPSRSAGSCLKPSLLR